MNVSLVEIILKEVGCQRSKGSFSGATCFENLKGTDPEKYPFRNWCCSTCKVWYDRGFDPAEMPRDTTRKHAQ